MEATVIITLIAIVILQVANLLKKSKEKGTGKVVISDLKLYNNDSFIFSKEVFNMCLIIISNPEYYVMDNFTISNIDKNEGIELWIGSGKLYNRFYTHDIDLKGEVDRLNSKLTKYDLALIEGVKNSLKNSKLNELNIKINN